MEYIPHLGREDTRGRRQADDYQPYRLAVYYVEENITNSSTVIPMLKDESGGFQMAVDYLQRVLSVIRADYNLTITPICTAVDSSGNCTSTAPYMCGDYATVPPEHLTGNAGVDADYILYVTAYNEGKFHIISMNSVYGS